MAWHRTEQTISWTNCDSLSIGAFFCTVIFNQDTQKNASRKCIWKCRQRNVSHLLVLNALNIISLINYKTATILNYIIWKQIHQHLGTCCPGLCISRRGHLNCDKVTVEMTSSWDAKSPKDVFGGLDSSLGKHRVLAGLLLHMQLQLVTSMSQSLKDYPSFSCELKFKLRKYQTIFTNNPGILNEIHFYLYMCPRYAKIRLRSWLLACWCRAITWTNVDLLSIGPMETNFGENGNKTFLLRKCIWKCYLLNVCCVVSESLC